MINFSRNIFSEIEYCNQLPISTTDLYIDTPTMEWQQL